MTLSEKERLLSAGGISSQEALVQKLLSGGIKPIRRAIPGGKTMMEQVDKPGLEGLFYNHLRGCGGFSEVKFSFAKEPESFPLKVSRVEAFDVRDQRPFWETKQEARRDLAKMLAKHVSAQRIVYAHIKPDGLYVATDTSGKFTSKVTVTEALKAKHEELADRELGAKAPSPDWEPWIEFVPSNKSRYTSYHRE